MQLLAVLATVCVSNPWVLIPTSLIVVVFLLLRAYYLKNSREIKRLEAVGETAVGETVVADVYILLKRWLQLEMKSTKVLNPWHSGFSNVAM